ncbi:hypothetical protein D6779_11665 [Candidatus Parcubacteria bacterium]|nr:MAG: hypothetical protein D6779_11665 [Candidatus Parcubacteria bacterium]
MAYQGRVEIDFYGATQASIRVQIASPVSLSRFGETLLFSSYALRQMHNLGIGHIVTTSLARSLVGITDCRAPIKLMLGPPSLSKRDIRRALSSSNPLAAARHVWSDEIQIVKRGFFRGKKRFDGILKFTESESGFLLDVKGFGMMGEGVNYYAPLSVAILLNYLANTRKSDDEYLSALATVASKCGEAVLSHQVSITSQLTLPIAFNNSAWAS